MRKVRSLPFLVAAAVSFASVHCSGTDDDAVPDESDASVVDASTPGPDADRPDATARPDSGPPDSSAPDADAPDADAAAPELDASVTSSLEAVDVGLPTTMPGGPIAIVRGTAQWRANAAGGGRLSVRLLEATGGRTVELTLRDGDGTLEEGESFVAASSTGMPDRAYVSTLGTTRWLAQGDGTVTVTAIDSSSVTLVLANVGQFATGDTFSLRGRIVVSLLADPETSDARGSTLAISSVVPEPFTNEPANMAGLSGSLAAATTPLGDRPVPYSHDQRSLVLTDTALATRRHLVVSFPRGHLPQNGESIALTDFDAIRVAYTEGADLTDSTKLWEADRGTAVVTERTATGFSIRLDQARMQSESFEAKGMFQLDGTLRVSLPPGG